MMRNTITPVINRISIILVILGLPILVEAKTWTSKPLPDAFTANTIISLSSGVYVGGVNHANTPSVWRLHGGRWKQILPNELSNGTVNSLQSESNGNLLATLAGVSYSWQSNIISYNPKTKNWSPKGVRNGAKVWSGDNEYGYAWSVGSVQVRIAPALGMLDGFSGANRPGGINPMASVFNAVGALPDGRAYVGGLYSHYASTLDAKKTAQKPALWLYDSSGFTEVPVPEWQAINSVKYEGVGGDLIVAANDVTNGLEVYRYPVLANAVSEFVALGSIKSVANRLDLLQVSQRGGIYAAGLNKKGRAALWKYSRKKSNWDQLGLRNCRLIFDFMVDKSERIYLVGNNKKFKPSVWFFK